MFSVSVSKIVGSASETRWSQVHTFKPAEEKLPILGELILAVGLRSKEGSEDAEFNMALVGKEFIQRFHEQYYGSNETILSPLKHLSKVVKQIVNEFDYLKINLVTGVVLASENNDEKRILYVVQVGVGEALLAREKKIFRLIDSDKSKARSSSHISISGFVKDEDLLFLVAGDMEGLLSMETIESALDLEEPEEVSSLLAPIFHKNQNSGIAVVVGKVGEGDFKTHQLKESGIRKYGVGRKRSVFGWWGRFLNKWQKLRETIKVRRQKDIIVKEGEDKQRRLMFSVAFILLVLLGVSVFFGWRRREALKLEEKFAEVLELSDHQYNEAVSLFELNPMRSRSLLLEAKSLVGEIVTRDSENFSKKQMDQLNVRFDEINELLEQVSGEHKIEKAIIFMDLNLVRPDTIGDELALHGETLVVLDKDSEILLRIDIKKKAADAVGGGSLMSGASVATVYSDRGFVLANSGLVEVSLSGKTSALVVERDSEWGEIIDLVGFAGNLYLLDKSQGEIFRYQGTEGGFGRRDRWLGEGVFPDFSKARSMTIDGDIWILSQEKVMRFRRGSKENFVIAGLNVALSEPVAIHTDEDFENIYILDRGNRRVLVVGKNGEYNSQYLWGGIESVTDMVVSEEVGKIFLLSESTIYEIELEE